ncbi:urease accessory protein UreD [Ferrovibrio sp.]|uniref:urease accessory protein UreD n=1 Tax=Ferrovibrio sp. TaxID=1917215 RepID=UPI0035AF1AED
MTPALMGDSGQIKLERGDGAVLARFKTGPVAEGGARLADLYQASPGRALQPRPEPGEAACMVLLTTSGGLTGGDRLRLDITAEADASLMVMAQAAEKVYRSASNDADTRLTQRLEVQSGARVEWLPQETILFDGARLHRSFDIHLADQASWALVGDITVFGRVARGESFSQGRLFDHWQVFRAGRLIWTDRLGLDGDIPAVLGHPAGFDGARAQGSILCAGLDEAAQLAALENLRAGFEGLAVRCAATRIGGLLLVRMLGPDPAMLRQAYGLAWSHLRSLAGWAQAMPRLWLR